MSKLTYQVKYPGGVPCNNSLLRDSENLYEANPEFRDSLVVGLLKAAVNRTNGKGNTKMDKEFIKFYIFFATYIPKDAVIVLTKL